MGTMKSVAATISKGVTQASGILCPLVKSFLNKTLHPEDKEGHSAPLAVRPSGLPRELHKPLASSASQPPLSPHVSSELHFLTASTQPAPSPLLKEQPEESVSEASLTVSLH